MRKPTTIFDILKRNIQNISEANSDTVLQICNRDIPIFENPQIKFHKINLWLWKMIFYQVL